MRDRLRGVREGEPTQVVPGRIRLLAPAARVRGRVPSRYATVEADGEEACIVSSRGNWSQGFLVWMATLDESMEVLGPPQLVEAAQVIVSRLSAAA